jgi:hypothetical protein
MPDDTFTLARRNVSPLRYRCRVAFARSTQSDPKDFFLENAKWL